MYLHASLDHQPAVNFWNTVYKGGITPEEDHEDLTTSWKIEGRSESVVKLKQFSGLQDQSTS